MGDVTEAIETYRFNDAAGTLYRFIWNQFCDWYLELLKPVFGGEDEAAKAESQACAAYVLEETYKLLPMLQEWLDDNLPTLVERLVREEIERVARGPRR